MNKKLLIISGIVIGLLMVAGAVKLLTSSLAPHGTLSLTVAPNDAKVSIDKQTAVTTTGDIRLTPGTHSLLITRDGFSDKALSVTIAKDQVLKQTVHLDVPDDASQTDLSRYADKAADAQDSAPAENDTPSQTDQLTEMLPYGGSDFEIDYSTEQENPGEATTTTIEILSSTDVGTTHALDWIKAQGFDPKAIHYITRPKDIDD